MSKQISLALFLICDGTKWVASVELIYTKLKKKITDHACVMEIRNLTLTGQNKKKHGLTKEILKNCLHMCIEYSFKKIFFNQAGDGTTNKSKSKGKGNNLLRHK